MKKRLKYLFVFSIVFMLAGCHSHVYSAATCTDPQTCTVCGVTQGEPNGHKYDDATCTHPKTCSICSETIGEALPHDFLSANCTDPKTCNICGYTEGEPNGHKFSEGSCTEDQVCAVCGEVITAPGHKWEDADCTTPKSCMVCEATEGEPLGHKGSNNICDICGQELVSIDDILKVCGLTASCENSGVKCIIDIESDHNPYDVAYDYGEDYNEMIKKCDWSLVFDAKYYKKTFPMLALQYHYNDELLLEHFQTVGIHEGRQGNDKFNVTAYYYNCSNEVYNAFGRNFEGYYFYYMINYEAEKNVNTLTANNGKEVKVQLKKVMTHIQKIELQNINKYRNEVGVDDVELSSELCAFANYRAYLQVEENWAAHDWAIQNEDKLWEYIVTMAGKKVSYAENTVTHNENTVNYNVSLNYYYKYYKSKEHYDAMVSDQYNSVGVSNTYFGLNNGNHTYTEQKTNKYQGSQFDVYLADVLSK